MSGSAKTSFYMCVLCGYIYDEAKGLPASGIPADTDWCSLPGDWRCPDCGTSKKNFDPVRLDKGS